jgi:hypothetical protein
VRPASLDVGLQDRLCYAKYFLSQKLGSRACPGAISPRILQLPQTTEVDRLSYSLSLDATRPSGQRVEPQLFPYWFTALNPQ